MAQYVAIPIEPNSRANSKVLRLNLRVSLGRTVKRASLMRSHLPAFGCRRSCSYSLEIRVPAGIGSRFSRQGGELMTTVPQPEHPQEGQFGRVRAATRERR